MNQKQMQQCRQVTQEELAKTQVLNLEDVKEIAKYEKNVSKRPAFLFAFAGILAITLGFSYPNIMTAIDSMPSTVSSSFVENIEKDTTSKKEVETLDPNTGTCTYNTALNSDGTQGSVTYNFIFQNNMLQSYTKVLVLNQIQEIGRTTIDNLYNTYKPLDILQINGYQIVTEYTPTGISIATTANLTILDKSLLPVETSQAYSNVEYNLGEPKESIFTTLSQNGYICK